MQEQIKELIKKYNYLLSGNQELISECKAKGLENFNFEDTENYGFFLGKSELCADIIDDLKQLIS
jgi:flagellar capping protein FliD